LIRAVNAEKQSNEVPSFQAFDPAGSRHIRSGWRH
jgi:hypothetical protein